jgi:ATP-dependent Clp protease ATP-binding subunit ClpA
MFGQVRSMRVVAQLLSGAEALALEMGDELPGAEHVVLAAMELPEGSAGTILDSFGVDEAMLRTAVLGVHSRALASVGITDLTPSPSSTPQPAVLYRSAGSARALLDRTRTALRDYPARTLCGAHVLIAASRFESGTLSAALADLAVDREALWTRAVEELTAADP